MAFDNDEKRKEIVALVKAGGQEIIDLAEDIVGCGDLITSIDLTLYFDETTNLPRLSVNRTYLGGNALKLQGFNELAEKITNLGDVPYKEDKEPGLPPKNSLLYNVGDQIKIGDYTATCVRSLLKTYEPGYAHHTFCFDTYLDTEMTRIDFLAKLEVWFQSYKWFDEIRDDVEMICYPGCNSHLRVPYAGEMFTKDSLEAYCFSDRYTGAWEKQWPCMADNDKRIATLRGCPATGWLMNSAKISDRCGCFATVSWDGKIGSASRVTEFLGVRPVFVLRQKLYS